MTNLNSRKNESHIRKFMLVILGSNAKLRKRLSNNNGDLKLKKEKKTYPQIYVGSTLESNLISTATMSFNFLKIASTSRHLNSRLRKSTHSTDTWPTNCSNLLQQRFVKNGDGVTPLAEMVLCCGTCEQCCQISRLKNLASTASQINHCWIAKHESDPKPTIHAGLSLTVLELTCG